MLERQGKTANQSFKCEINIGMVSTSTISDITNKEGPK